MLKKIAVLLIIIISTSCNKSHQEEPACPLKVCTDVFTTIGISFTDNKGNPIAVENLLVLDLRTSASLPLEVNGIFYILGYYRIADDSDLSQLSTGGDDIQVTATDPATNQTITTLFKIAGGCNCHVTKISGPNQVTFN